MRAISPAQLMVLAVAAGLAMRGVLWWHRVGRPGAAQHVAEPAPGGLALIVPVLTEQQRLARLIAHVELLRAGGERVELVLASTTREPVTTGTPTTPQLCERWAARHSWICHHQVDDPGGTMASQLNGALAHCSRVRAARYVGFYNADSLPAPGSLRAAVAIVARSDRPVVVQQHALYLRNWRALGAAGPVARAILRAAAAWQCRWSLGFERVHATRCARANGVALDGANLAVRRGLWSGPAPFAYVIGHGLLIERDELVAAGYFTERFPNEDAHLSVALAARGVAVAPNPYWELADSPDTIRGLLVQKRVWFHGPAAALRYPRDLRERRVARSRDLIWPACALFHHAVCWAAGPLFAVTALGAAATGGLATVLAVAAALLAYLVPANDLALRRAAAWSGLRLRPGERLEAALGAPLAYALHGVSAYWALGLSLRHAVFGITPGKPRTPMRPAPDPPALPGLPDLDLPEVL